MMGPGLSALPDVALSPALIAGVVLRIIPQAPMQAAVRIAVNGLRRTHPSLFLRLAELNDTLIAVHPTDLPIGFTLRFGGEHVFDARVHDRLAMPSDATVTIWAPFALLLRLIEGRIDGDAVFFSREFAFEGDTDVVLRMRNILESEEIDLAHDLLRGFGMPEPAARGLGERMRRLAEAAGHDLTALHEAAVGPLSCQQAAIGAAAADLRAELEGLRWELRRIRKPGARAERAPGPADSAAIASRLPRA